MFDLSALPPLLGCVAPLVFGVALLMAVRVLYDDSDARESDVMHAALRVASATLIVCGLLAVAICFSGGVALVVALVALALAFQRSRRAEQSVLLLALAAAMERNMPLVPIVEAFAAEHRGKLRRQALRLAEQLKAGVPLSEAADQTSVLVPADVRLSIRMGLQSGDLARALRDLIGARQSHDTLWMQVGGRLMYLAVLVVFSWSIGAFMLWKIAPQFQMIFNEFGSDLPAMTRFTFGASRALGATTPLPILFFPLAFFSLVYFTFRYIGWVQWDLPGMTWLMRRQHTATILGALALAAERGQSLSDAVGVLSASYPNRAIRRRLRRALRDVDAGEDWAASLACRRLIGRADLAVLRAAARVGNLAWAMREMATSSSRRLAYRMQGWVQVLFALAILSLGALVLVFVVSFFVPLIALIQKLV